MKNLAYILILASGLFFLNACDNNDTDGTIYDGTNSEASFATESSDYTFSDGDPESFEVTVQRGITSGAASVAVSVSDPSGFFTVPSAVEFADGAYEATIPVTFSRSKLTAGKAYEIVISVPENPVSTKLVSHTVTITRDYTWTPFATGEYYSGLFNQKWEQPLEKADGVNRYKLTAPFAEGYDLTFDVAEDGSVTILAPQNASGTYNFATGYVDKEYGMIYMELHPDTFIFDPAGKTIKINVNYTISIGKSFGVFDDVFTWK